jgi:hypothetical protein
MQHNVMTIEGRRLPLFIHAWFRSGSTYIWSKLRTDEKLICYYEPFHEVLAEPSLARQIDDFKAVVASVTLRHPLQERHYFYEYRELLEKRALNFMPEIPYCNYFLFPTQSDDSRHRYVETLLAHATSSGRMPVFCFCRSQMRSAWIRYNFSGAHVAQIRNPFSQWDSFSVLPSFRTTMIKTALDLQSHHASCFDHISNFTRFAAALEKRKSLSAEQLYEYFLKQDDFLAIFLSIWVLSTLQSVSSSDLTLDIDSLSTDASYRASVEGWFADHNCFVDLSDCAIPSASSADTEKAYNMIVEAGRAVRQSSSPMLICEPAKVAGALALMSDRSKKAVDLFLDR